MRTPSGEHVDTTDAKRIVVLASGTGSTFAALLAAQGNGLRSGRVAGLVTDKPDCGALSIARDHGVATALVAPADFADRAQWNRGLAAATETFRPDLVVLAGFMRILAPSFLDCFPGRVVNTHPALLPSFPGAHAVRDALAHGVKVTGCTVHIVDAGVDTGPILAQAPVPVLDTDDEASLHERIKAVERELLVETVATLLDLGIEADSQ